MSAEIQFRFQAGAQTYAVISNETSGFIWSTSGGTGAFGAFVSGSWADYAISATEQGVTGRYYADFPSNIQAGVYSIDARQQLGGSAAQTDPTVAVGDLNWNGSVVVPLANLATSGQIGQMMPTKLARGVMVTNFPIYLKSSSDHITPFTSGIVSGQIARDAGSFGALQSGNVTETGLGWYTVQALTSGDLNAGTVKLQFNAVGVSGGTSDPLPLSFVLQKSPVSGSV